MVGSRRSTALISVLMLGCSSGDDDVLRTEQLAAEMYMVATDANQTEAFVTLWDLQDQRVALPGGDHITVTVTNWVVELDVSIRSVEPVYTAVIPTTAGGEVYTVTAKRELAKNAPYSQVVMPIALELSVAAETVARGSEDLVISWAPSGEPQPLTLTIEGGCIDDLERAVHNDPGETTVEAGTLISAPGMASEDCPVEVTLHRFDIGVLDKTWRDGLIQARQSRSVWIETTP